MKGIQILTEKNKKEVKEHGSYTFPVQVSPEAIQSYEQYSICPDTNHVSSISGCQCHMKECCS